LNFVSDLTQETDDSEGYEDESAFDVDAPLEALLAEDITSLTSDQLTQRLAKLDQLTKSAGSLSSAIDEEVTLTKAKRAKKAAAPRKKKTSALDLIFGDL
jgi:hypothetical protein